MAHTHPPAHFRGCSSPDFSCFCREKRYLALIGVTSLILILELVGANITGSPSLWGDMWHVGGDNAPFFINLAVLILERRGVVGKRVSRIGNLVIFWMLVAVTAWILYRGVSHLVDPAAVESKEAIVFAIAGMIGNVVQLKFLAPLAGAHHHESSHEGPLSHVKSDLLSSGAVIAGNGLNWATGLSWFEGVATIVVSILVLRIALRLYTTIQNEK